MNLTIKDKIILLVCSAFAGLANGFLGGGGGVVVVTLLLTVLKLPQKKAQATALLIIVPLTAVSLVVYLLGKDVQWDIVLYSTLGVFLGGTVGALLLNKLQGNTAKILFAVLLVAGGIKMLIAWHIESGGNLCCKQVYLLLAKLVDSVVPTNEKDFCSSVMVETSNA